ncbi:XdhC family protein [Marinobacter sp. MDS2]|uniref:XdhC family protein n=1 Tax=Marinobacter sp. MDS2 TaxID=3065961 RepID=UPI00273B9BE1|nr:XdhC family protein [Marinobacter sp. MDS2]MDP4548549.1 XdhC family protein [Marinobacter sp. MDS2]
MQPLDIQVVEHAIRWSKASEDFWLCTVLSTFGSSPRAPGSWLIAKADGDHCGSLSGGCVEEDFLSRLSEGEFRGPVNRIRYGASDGPDNPRVSLPCGGVLDVLVEHWPANEQTIEHFLALKQALGGAGALVRDVCLESGCVELIPDHSLGSKVEEVAEQQRVRLRVGPVSRLLIAGLSPVSTVCASFAHSLGFEVIVCDPRPEEVRHFNVPGVTLRQELPSVWIAREGCHRATAVVALTHDPKIDDTALIEAVKTEAFYIGVMGSQKTSEKRRERLLRIGGLTEAQADRIHMPIGLNIGSKTPAEIALSVMADVVRVREGVTAPALHPA